jgi:predicted transcriptional regulator of viral defense system
MKSKINLLEQLKPLPHFSKDTIYQLGTQLGLKETTLNTYISRFLKYKEILQLKKGLYVSNDFFEKNHDDISYSFYLANVLRTPSYISSWAALQYYNLATEAIYAITSVTPKVTRNYQTKAGNFTYQSIKKDLFSDFLLVNNKFKFFIATPAKALFDLLYFRTNQFRGFRLKEINALIEELRIDIEEMAKTDRDKFYSLLEKYL